VDSEDPDRRIVPSSHGESPSDLRLRRDQEDRNAELLGKLSPRQREVFQWICEGKRDREIGIILGISYRTVTVHVRAILAKLGVENRTCAAMMGARSSLRHADGAQAGKNTLV